MHTLGIELHYFKCVRMLLLWLVAILVGVAKIRYMNMRSVELDVSFGHFGEGSRGSCCVRTWISTLDLLWWLGCLLFWQSSNVETVQYGAVNAVAVVVVYAVALRSLRSILLLQCNDV